MPEQISLDDAARRLCQEAKHVGAGSVMMTARDDDGRVLWVVAAVVDPHHAAALYEAMERITDEEGEDDDAP